MENQKTGIFPMVGDLLHPGHLKALEYAKLHCDKLIVALNTSPTGKTPLETVYERYCRLSACKYVDQIIPYAGEADLLSLLTSTQYDIRFVGADHVDGWTGQEYEQCNHITACIIPRQHEFSSTRLRNKIKG